MNRFTGALFIPTYDSMSYYNFFDVLAVLVKYVFEQQYEKDFKDRK